jgi:hypothetical protein
MPKTVFRTVAAACLLGLLAVPAAAQITITSSEIPHQVGDTLYHKYNVGTATVQVGTMGGPWTWTFDTSTFVGGLRYVALVNKDLTPFGALFPDAGYATWVVSDTVSLVMVNFWLMEQSELNLLGMGWVEPDTTYAVRFNPTYEDLSLPMTMGTQWDAEASWRIDVNDSTWLEITRRSHAAVDAWGTAVVPLGSYECLRVDRLDTTFSALHVGGQLLFTDTMFFRTYEWWVENAGNVASAEGPEHDTSYNFTQSNCYWVLHSRRVGAIAELPAAGAVLTLRVCTPFAGQTRVPGRERESFELYDVSGKLVATQPGLRIGAGLPAGIYSLKSRTGEAARVVKIR